MQMQMHMHMQSLIVVKPEVVGCVYRCTKSPASRSVRPPAGTLYIIYNLPYIDSLVTVVTVGHRDQLTLQSMAMGGTGRLAVHHSNSSRDDGPRTPHAHRTLSHMPATCVSHPCHATLNAWLANPIPCAAASRTPKLATYSPACTTRSPSVATWAKSARRG